MNNFIFCNPTELIFGKGTIESIGKHVPSGSTVMMTYGGGSIKKNGVYDRVTKALGGCRLVEFGGIEPNPCYETLMKAVALAKSEGVDFLLAVGGGSVIDGTKFISCALGYDGADPWDFVLDGSRLKDVSPMPFATVLTLPATGSEMNNGAVITRQSSCEKLAFKHRRSFPRFSVLDPEVCYSLPARQVANGVADTFAHVLEQYLTYPCDAMVQDRFAEGVLSTLVEIGAKVVADHSDYDLVANYMFSATMGLNGIIAMGVPEDWATHMIGHELTAFCGLDHGVTLAIVFPALMSVMRADKHDKLLQYGRRVWGIDSGSPDVRIDKAIDLTRRFFESLGIKTRLSDYGIGDDVIKRIVDRMRERGWRLGERAAIDADTVRRILEAAR
ncbi:MAG: iron-containing alcohol dehydrogenase [Rikenellaceae bacterium]|nr:iron-containing alcohol dehydrogenase [Rikenellaceae bacterium]